jgi:hypothetical protein
LICFSNSDQYSFLQGSRASDDIKATNKEDFSIGKIAGNEHMQIKPQKPEGSLEKFQVCKNIII